MRFKSLPNFHGHMVSSPFCNKAFARRKFLKTLLVAGLGQCLAGPLPGVEAAESATKDIAENGDRLIPQLPPVNERLRLILDSDAANEIDDLYAIALAIASPERFNIEGFVATHFAARSGPESIGLSYDAIKKILELTNTTGKYPLKHGGHPMNYARVPSESEGADWIISRAHAGSAEKPLWVVGIGAATNLVSAILKDPNIIPKVRYVFHARSSQTWPERSVQFNVAGDINAARALLASRVPLVWFDTGTNLTATMTETEKRLNTTKLGQYLHQYRNRQAYFARSDKGFFDLGDIAWMLQPALCKSEEVPVPLMDSFAHFQPSTKFGRMLRVFSIERDPTWELFYDKIAKYG